MSVSVEQKNRKFGRAALFIAVVSHLILLPLHLRHTNQLSLVETSPKETPQAIRIKLQTKEAQQIVRNTSKDSVAEPTETKFLSERDQYFDRQTIARDTGSFQEPGGSEGAGQAQESTQAAAVTPPTNRGIRFSDLSIEQHQLEFSNFKPERKVAQEASPGQDQGGRAQSNDYVEDIPLGDITQLNTQEYMYYGYYHRIRQRLEQHWGSSLQESAERLYRTGRRLPANSQRITGVTVTMDDKGNIIDVKIRNASGVAELDDAAVESFNRAGPFPNPPQGMVVNGRIQIDWGFVVKS
jgi:TonB family protein